MERWVATAAILAAPTLLAGKPLDLILLIQNTPGLIRYTEQTDLRTLNSNDRISLVTFSKESTIEVPFTHDHAQIETNLRKPPSKIHFRKPESSTKIHIWNAVREATTVFDRTSATRTLIVLFADEDPSTGPEIEAARKALHQSNVVFCAAAVGKELPLKLTDRNTQTPPTVPSRHPQITTRRARIPEQTLEATRKLANESGCTISRDEWNLSAFIQQIRAKQ